MKVSKFEIKLIQSYLITHKIKHLVFKKVNNDKFNFIPGQFITFLLEHKDGKIRRRSYSVATFPKRKNYIEIAISYVAGGIASETLFNSRPNDKFHVIGPAGRLVLQEDKNVNKLVLVGTGTGITPYRAMLPRIEELLKLKVKEAHIFLGVKYRKDVIYADDFLKYSNSIKNLYFTTCFSRENSKLSFNEVKGYVQCQLNYLNLNPQYDLVYLCGNPNMIDNTFSLLIKQGFDPKLIRREKYISSN